MDRLRDELLADAALALDEHDAAAVGDLIDLPVQAAHRRARADHALEGAAVGEEPPEQAVVVAEPPRRESVADRLRDRLGVEGLGHVVLGAAPHRLDGVRDRSVRRHHEHDLVRQARAHLREELESVHPRHPDVGEHEVEGSPFERGEPLLRVRRDLHDVTGASQRAPEEDAHGLSSSTTSSRPRNSSSTTASRPSPFIARLLGRVRTKRLPRPPR
ncbi:MAG: hypothetical protein R3F20_10665 [Planctomycetota bacterium]